MTILIKVKFPQGVREVPAHFETDNGSYFSRDPCPSIPCLVPDDMCGWCFEQIIGEIEGTSWLAFPAMIDVKPRSFDPFNPEW